MQLKPEDISKIIKSPVSYTHLDVYKRQGLRFIPFAPGRYDVLRAGAGKAAGVGLSLIHIYRLCPIFRTR